jgi:hypothetical protein
MWLISENKNVANDVVPTICILSSVYLWTTFRSDNKLQVSYELLLSISFCSTNWLQFQLNVIILNLYYNYIFIMKAPFHIIITKTLIVIGMHEMGPK